MLLHWPGDGQAGPIPGLAAYQNTYTFTELYLNAFTHHFSDQDPFSHPDSHPSDSLANPHRYCYRYPDSHRVHPAHSYRHAGTFADRYSASPA
jgi:hypothetical protein